MRAGVGAAGRIGEAVASLNARGDTRLAIVSHDIGARMSRACLPSPMPRADFLNVALK